MAALVSALLVGTVAARASEAPPIVPQSISNAEMEQANLFGVGCAFLPGRLDGDLIALADDVRGVIKFDGNLVHLAPDTKSEDMPYGAKARYVGSGYDLRFAKTVRKPKSVGYESEDWPATMTISDRQGRVVFTASGTLNCGA